MPGRLQDKVAIVTGAGSSGPGWGNGKATSVLFAYWGLFTWIPGFLSASRERGGAGLSIVRTSGFIVPMQMGAFAGYVAHEFVPTKDPLTSLRAAIELCDV